MSSYAGSPKDHRDSIEILKGYHVDAKKMITHRLPFNEIGKGFQLVVGAKESLKVVVDPTR